MLSMYSNILVPVDRGITTKSAAVDEARQLAKNFNATLHGLNVCFEERYTSEMYEIRQEVVESDSDSSDSEEEMTEAINGFESYLKDADIESTTAVRTGDSADEILNYAETEDIDLIVMMTHGRSGIERLVLGSVTESTLRHAPCPVLSISDSKQ